MGVSSILPLALGGLLPGIFGGNKSKGAPQPVTPPVAPTVTNKQPDLDAADQKTAARLAGGRTSTMLAGSSGFEESSTKTSKVLLGS